ncbi:MAG: hypothetical protein K2X47_08720 [Bdellovibrionales bacterium]|nr:hypothetical protein [Bdellovibrionales bacterium]
MSMLKSGIDPSRLNRMNSPSRAICTVFATSSLAKVKTLFRSIQEAHPKEHFSFFALITDSETNDTPAEIQNCQIYHLKDLENLPNLRRAGFQYCSGQFEMLLKPFFLKLLFSREEFQDVIYLDAENLVLGSLAPLFLKFEKAPILLTPHLLSPIPEDGASPTNKDILVLGCFNLGFIGLRRSGTAEKFLGWWAKHLGRQAGLASVEGLFIDQRWMDLAPAVFPEASILRSKIYNVAFWNLHEREVEYNSGTYVVDGEPLVFFQFQGFDPAFPHMLSNRQTRFRDLLPQSPVLRLCYEYASRLKKHQHFVYAELPYGFDFWDNGIRIPALARELLLRPEDWERFSDPQNTKREPSYFSWLMQGTENSAPRLLQEMWRRRPDLQKDFPDPNGRDRCRLLNWAVDYGVHEQHLDPRLARIFESQI